jgi:hypothetical protein
MIKMVFLTQISVQSFINYVQIDMLIAQKDKH